MASSSREQAMIQEIFAPLAKDPGAFALKDDAAMVRPPKGQDLIVTTDTLIEGIHFPAKEGPKELAQKALRVNLSDLAAKGAKPYRYLLNIALPGQIDHSWLKYFAAGLEADQDQFGISLLGGDSVKAPGGLMISITAFGLVPKGKMVKRSGARAGHKLYVTGTIGDGVLGLGVMMQDKALITEMGKSDRVALANRYRLPMPRVELINALRDNASAAMDISDGLAGDLALMCTALELSAEVNLDDIPLSPAAARARKRDPELMTRLITGGDDYELLMAVSKVRAGAFESACERQGVNVTQIGRFMKRTGVPVFLDDMGNALGLKQLSYSHF